MWAYAQQNPFLFAFTACFCTAFISLGVYNTAAVLITKKRPREHEDDEDKTTLELVQS